MFYEWQIIGRASRRYIEKTVLSIVDFIGVASANKTFSNQWPYFIKTRQCWSWTKHSACSLLEPFVQWSARSETTQCVTKGIFRNACSPCATKSRSPVHAHLITKKKAHRSAYTTSSFAASWEICERKLCKLCATNALEKYLCGQDRWDPGGEHSQHKDLLELKQNSQNETFCRKCFQSQRNRAWNTRFIRSQLIEVIQSCDLRK